MRGTGNSRVRLSLERYALPISPRLLLMTGSVSSSDAIERVDLAALVRTTATRLGVLQFETSGEAPVDESFETMGDYDPTSGKRSAGLGVSVNLERHSVRVTLSPPDDDAILVLDDASLPSLVGDASSMQDRVFDPNIGTEADASTDPHVAVFVEAVDASAADAGIRASVRVVRGGRIEVETIVRCERGDAGWQTTVTWSTN